LTFKDFKKRLSLEITQQQSKLFERLLNKPFWIWNTEQHKLEASISSDIAYLRNEAKESIKECVTETLARTIPGMSYSTRRNNQACI
jgi:hypothetical protein